MEHSVIGMLRKIESFTNDIKTLVEMLRFTWQEHFRQAFPPDIEAHMYRAQGLVEYIITVEEMAPTFKHATTILLATSLAELGLLHMLWVLSNKMHKLVI